MVVGRVRGRVSLETLRSAFRGRALFLLLLRPRRLLASPRPLFAMQSVGANLRSGQSSQCAHDICNLILASVGRNVSLTAPAHTVASTSRAFRPHNVQRRKYVRSQSREG